MAASGSEQLLALFGVNSDSVALLNPIKDGHLQVGLDVVAWNRFLERSPKLSLEDMPQLVKYACLIYSLAENMFPGQPADPEARAELSSDSTRILIDLPSLRMRLSLGVRGDILELVRLPGQ
jgi:hypothetical protein